MGHAQAKHDGRVGHGRQQMQAHQDPGGRGARVVVAVEIVTLGVKERSVSNTVQVGLPVATRCLRRNREVEEM